MLSANMSSSSEPMSAELTGLPGSTPTPTSAVSFNTGLASRFLAEGDSGGAGAADTAEGCGEKRGGVVAVGCVVDWEVDDATATAAASSDGRRRRGFRTAEARALKFDVDGGGVGGGGCSGGSGNAVGSAVVAAISFRRAVATGREDGAAAAAARVCQTACEERDERHLKRLAQPASGQAKGVAPECNRACALRLYFLVKRFVQPGWVHACPPWTVADAAIEAGREATTGDGGGDGRGAGCAGVGAESGVANCCDVDAGVVLSPARVSMSPAEAEEGSWGVGVV